MSKAFLLFSFLMLLSWELANYNPVTSFGQWRVVHLENCIPTIN